MSHLPSLTGATDFPDVFRLYPRRFALFLRMLDEVLRADSPFSVAERELMAASISAQNACTYCYESHKPVAAAFGIDEGLFDALARDLATAPVDDKLKPVLAFARKLTLEPARVVRADADAVYAAGWDERAILEAVQVCALFNMMNRVVEGTGIDFDYAAEPGAHPAKGGRPEDHTRSYSDFGARIAARTGRGGQG